MSPRFSWNFHLPLADLHMKIFFLLNVTREYSSFGLISGTFLWNFTGCVIECIVLFDLLTIGQPQTQQWRNESRKKQNWKTLSNVIGRHLDHTSNLWGCLSIFFSSVWWKHREHRGRSGKQRINKRTRRARNYQRPLSYELQMWKRYGQWVCKTALLIFTDSNLSYS